MGIDTRERILQAGSKAMIAKSYNGCGLKEILEAAEVPKGSFYHYFKSKEDFGVAVLEQMAEVHAERMRELLGDRSKPALERIRTLFEWLADWYHEHGATRAECLVSKMALEVGQLSEPMRNAIKYAYDRWTALLARAIRDAQTEGSVSPSLDAEATAKFVLNAWEGATIRMQMEGGFESLDVFLEFVFSQILTPRDG
ncbi:MAG: TetR family transcriptional regulator C-terminal domain-containing protein [Planctomycetota bacterium]